MSSHFEHSEEFSELLTLYSLGVLDEQEAQPVKTHLRTGCEICVDELRSFVEVAAVLPHALDEVSPDPRVREQLLARISSQSSDSLENPLPGVFVLRKAAGRWRKTAFPGVTFKTLYVDRETETATSLLRLEPGAKYPAHHHVGVEQCLVIEGTVRIGPISLSTGDFEYAEMGTNHDVVESDTGCILLIMSDQRDELLV